MFKEVNQQMFYQSDNNLFLFQYANKPLDLQFCNGLEIYCVSNKSETIFNIF
jgi:hypothetical protein